MEFFMRRKKPPFINQMNAVCANHEMTEKYFYCLVYFVLHTRRPICELKANQVIKAKNRQQSW
jgi:hypothetical protein